MAEPLSEALVQRLRERAQDPARRSGDAALAADSVSMRDGLDRLGPDRSRGEEHRAAVEEYVSGVNSPLAGVIFDLASGDGSRARGLLAALGSRDHAARLDHERVDRFVRAILDAVS